LTDINRHSSKSADSSATVLVRSSSNKSEHSSLAVSLSRSKPVSVIVDVVSSATKSIVARRPINPFSRATPLSVVSAAGPDTAFDTTSTSGAGGNHNDTHNNDNCNNDDHHLAPNLNRNPNDSNNNSNHTVFRDSTSSGVTSIGALSVASTNDEAIVSVPASAANSSTHTSQPSKPNFAKRFLLARSKTSGLLLGASALLDSPASRSSTGEVFALGARRPPPLFARGFTPALVAAATAAAAAAAASSAAAAANSTGSTATTDSPDEMSMRRFRSSFRGSLRRYGSADGSSRRATRHHRWIYVKGEWRIAYGNLFPFLSLCPLHSNFVARFHFRFESHRFAYFRPGSAKQKCRLNTSFSSPFALLLLALLLLSCLLADLLSLTAQITT
jgi:hypothetical protein